MAGESEELSCSQWELGEKLVLVGIIPNMQGDGVVPLYSI